MWVLASEAGFNYGTSSAQNIRGSCNALCKPLPAFTGTNHVSTGACRPHSPTSADFTGRADTHVALATCDQHHSSKGPQQNYLDTARWRVLVYPEYVSLFSSKEDTSQEHLCAMTSFFVHSESEMRMFSENIIAYLVRKKEVLS